MNRVILMGRLTRDPEVRYSQTQSGEQMAIARYTLAIDRMGKNKDADFPSCVAFGKQGEFAEKYLKKGMKIAVEGRIQTGSYTNKEGQKVYTTDVVVEKHEFCEGRSEQSEAQEPPTESASGFISVPQSDIDSLPFRK